MPPLLPIVLPKTRRQDQQRRGHAPFLTETFIVEFQSLRNLCNLRIGSGW